MEAEVQPGKPVTLIIPKLGITTQVELAGLDSTGAMEVPKLPEDVAWYKLGARPGMPGNAVIAGHLDWTAGPAVFWHLNELSSGDTVTVVDDKQVSWEFKVTKVASYAYIQFPLQHVFGDGSEANLNLITCAGQFNHSTKNYSNRMVVYTQLVGNHLVQP